MNFLIYMKDLKTLVKEYSDVTGITEGYSDSLLQASIKSKDKTVSSWVIPGGGAMCDTKASLIKDIESHIDGTFDDVELTFNITPGDANVVVNVTSPETAVVSGNVVKVNAGETVEYTITAEGYDDKSGSEKVDSDKSIDIELTKKQVTLTITTTPDEATVKFNDGEVDPDKAITVDYGTSVKYTVSAEGYNEVSDSKVVTEDSNVPVTLTKKQFTLTITTTPEEATVKFNDGAVDPDKAITVDYNTTVKYTVSAEGYTEVSDNKVVNEDSTVPVTLNKKQVTLTLNVTPAGATILFDDEPSEGNSKTVDYGSNVKYNVSLEGYKTVEATESNLTESKIIPITLEANDPVEDPVEDEGAGMIEAS